MHDLVDHPVGHQSWRCAEYLSPQHGSFRHYVETRKYDFGRGTRAAWAFIAAARGDPHFPDARSWRELRRYLEASGANDAKLAAARAVWSSYGAWRSRARRSGDEVVRRRR